ncbi:hypothetical protein B0T20DRAFT_464664 [Sordaria brevicollis]|uniref:Uncharacterized protein n=1 Tax=Sordaria brevicollis TaxID=83679 RepID=A0AAE0NWF9_SORBR|nr:hypothetical protein B0T20DRAFT_464664 [Sordaria brevicollis]
MKSTVGDIIAELLLYSGTACCWIFHLPAQRFQLNFRTNNSASVWSNDAAVIETLNVYGH